LPLDPDPDSKSGSGSKDLIESGSNPDPDPQHCCFHQLLKYLFIYWLANFIVSTWIDIVIKFEKIRLLSELLLLQIIPDPTGSDTLQFRTYSNKRHHGNDIKSIKLHSIKEYDEELIILKHYTILFRGIMNDQQFFLLIISQILQIQGKLKKWLTYLWEWRESSAEPLEWIQCAPQTYRRKYRKGKRAPGFLAPRSTPAHGHVLSLIVKNIMVSDPHLFQGFKNECKPGSRCGSGSRCWSRVKTIIVFLQSIFTLSYTKFNNIHKMR